MTGAPAPWRRPARAAALALLVAGATPGLLAAQDRGRSPAPAKALKPSAAKADSDADTEAEVSEVVVSAANRPQPGAVIGDIKPELQLGPGEIQSYGVSTVTELLDELAPQIRSDQGRGGESPVVLLNGRRISGFGEIRDIPTEAILRVEVLPEEVALKYGYSSDQRVVNIVLRRRFRAVTAELQGGGPTEGGQESGQAELDLLHIRGDNRVNLDVKYQASSRLTEDARDLTSPVSGRPYDLAGNVTPTAANGQIDPALSALLGQPVTIAGVPAAAGQRSLSLGDFAATAGVANSSDLGRYRTLSSATRQISANGVLARALPGRISATVNATLGATSSDSLQGLPGVGLIVPAGDPFSPFGSDVELDRYVEALGPLRQSVNGWTGHLGTTLNRDAGRWRLSLTGAYDHAESRTNSDTGLDATPLQALLTSASSSFNPFAPLPASLLTFEPQDKARSRSDGANLRFVASGPLLRVPAGQLNASLRIGDAQSWFATQSLRRGLAQAADMSRNDFNAQVNLDLPIARRSAHVLSGVGDLSINANAALDRVSDFGTLNTVGYGLNWTPLTGISLIVSHTRDQAAPSVQQLGNPVVLTPGARVFDFVTGQTVDVTRIDGGTRALISDHRDVLKIGLTLKPFSAQDLTLTANYIRSRIENPIETFPAATAEIEAAFPDRFTRNADGELVQVDNRPVNFARQDRQELRWGFNFSRAVGRRPPPPPPRFRRGGAEGDGPRARFDRDGGPSGRRDPRPGSDGAQDGPPSPPGPPDGGVSSGPTGAAAGAPNGAPSSNGGGGGGFGGGGRGGGPGGGGRGFGGGFGGRGFGGPGGPGGAQTQARVQFALYHTVFFEDRLLVRPGGPLLDLLNGSASGNGGGQARHEIEAQAGYTSSGLGARLSADWRSGTFIRGGLGSSIGDLSFSGLATVNLRLFANLGAMPSLVQRRPWLAGSRITLSVGNLFDQRVQVRDAAGATPLGYQPAYLDPAGRVVRLSLRKLFF